MFELRNARITADMVGNMVGRLVIPRRTETDDLRAATRAESKVDRRPLLPMRVHEFCPLLLSGSSQSFFYQVCYAWQDLVLFRPYAVTLW
jgi:hypothetical protein